MYEIHILFCCRHGFVRADRVLLLRELLDKLSSTAGLVNEEKGDLKLRNIIELASNTCQAEYLAKIAK